MESWHLLQIKFGPLAVLYCVMEDGNDTMISPSQRQAINNNGKVLGINLLEPLSIERTHNAFSTWRSICFNYLFISLFP